MNGNHRNKEIELKFLVSSDAWRRQVSSPVLLKQGYLSTDPERTVRVRLEGKVGKLTIKGRKVGAEAPEFEYEIPENDARYLLDKLCKPQVIVKDRYKIQYDGLTWEIDEFLEANEGLVVAEVEFMDQRRVAKKPEWVGVEITGDLRYTNARLSERPFKQWR
jgi:adenylate cyclase